MASHETVGAFYRGWHLMGIDGTILDLPDTPANTDTFGRPGSARAPAAFPQVRLLALCELGTHAICGLGIKPCRRSEQAKAPAQLSAPTGHIGRLTGKHGSIIESTSGQLRTWI